MSVLFLDKHCSKKTKYGSNLEIQNGCRRHTRKKMELTQVEFTRVQRRQKALVFLMQQNLHWIKYFRQNTMYQLWITCYVINLSVNLANILSMISALLALFFNQTKPGRKVRCGKIVFIVNKVFLFILFTLACFVVILVSFVRLMVTNVS